MPIGPDLLGVGVSATCASRAYRQSYFGVTPAQAGASGLPAFALGAGWSDTSLIFNLEHKFDAHWRLDAQWIRVLLTRSTAASPIGIGRRPPVGTLDAVA